jgi:hypothetical protein
MAKQLKITKQFFNKNFVVRRRPSSTGKGSSSLLAWDRLTSLVGAKMRDTIINKALESGKMKYTKKLRRGVTLEFARK